MITDIDINKLKKFKDYPFKLTLTENMKELIESIVINGIITPLIVRKVDNLYEIVSGHRRKYVAELLNIKKIPCIVKKMNDNEAILAMIDCNIDRENILPSERAFAYKMKLDAIKGQSKRISVFDVTPQEWKLENIEFTNMHMQSYSSTADSEYTFVTSTYPMENGMSYSKYFLNTYDNIFKMFNNKKYYTSYMHGNVASFWNRGNVYSRMNLDETVFIDKFEDTTEMISGYLSDQLFYKQAVEKIKQQQTEPFMTFLVSSSSHTAFDLPGIINRQDKINIDVGKYKDTFFGNYLESMNYADYAFGILIEELKKADLYEDLSILVFGDHNGLSMYNDDLQEFLKESKPDLTDIDLKLNYTRVLCAMKIPNEKNHIKINKVINKLDLKPTFAYLCNLEDGFSLGTNIFGSKDFICLNNERIIAQDYYYDGEWYYINSGERVDFDNISDNEQNKLQKYYDCMKKELDISFSVNINDLLKGKIYE